MLQIGVVGAPNKGKSTFFSAATLVDVAIANYPFTTIEPNKGMTYVRAACPHVEFGLASCNPKNSRCENGTRLIPTGMVDVAGLVPGASEGRGLGNKFLDDLRAADALIQVIDASGRTDLEGNPATGADPAEEIRFLEKEIDAWIASILLRSWGNIRSRGLDAVANVVSGLKVSPKDLEHVCAELGLNTEKIQWSEEEVLELATRMRKQTKPILVAANKMDLPGARENFERLKQVFPEKTIVPCFAEGELALRRAAKHGLIKYLPGDADFEVVNGTPEQKAALDKIRALVREFQGTGIQKLVDEATFNVLQLIPVYPVEDEHKLSNNLGDVLPDAHLLRRGSTSLDLAAKVHTDLAKHFICAVNAKTKMKVGKDYEIKQNDVLKIIAGK